ncbi:MAG: hypothetical protein WEB00_03815 [Dehalococcoidia bacterium]
MFRYLIPAFLVVSALLVGACAGDDDDGNEIVNQGDDDTESTATEEPTTAPTSESSGEPTAEATVEPTNEASEEPTEEPTEEEAGFTADDCPIDDAEFCDVAVQVANALVTEDEEAITQLSAEQEIVCGEVAVESFPECGDPADVLTGFVASGAQGENAVLGLGEYNTLVGLIDFVDASQSDDVGSGEMRVAAVGTRGDAHDLLATAILDTSEGVGRWYFIFTFEQNDDGAWFIHAFVSDTAGAFAGAGFNDPLTELSVDLQPWGA